MKFGILVILTFALGFGIGLARGESRGSLTGADWTALNSEGRAATVRAMIDVYDAAYIQGYLKAFGNVWGVTRPADRTLLIKYSEPADLPSFSKPIDSYVGLIDTRYDDPAAAKVDIGSFFECLQDGMICD